MTDHEILLKIQRTLKGVIEYQDACAKIAKLLQANGYPIDTPHKKKSTP